MICLRSIRIKCQKHVQIPRNAVEGSSKCASYDCAMDTCCRRETRSTDHRATTWRNPSPAPLLVRATFVPSKPFEVSDRRRYLGTTHHFVFRSLRTFRHIVLRRSGSVEWLVLWHSQLSLALLASGHVTHLQRIPLVSQNGLDLLECLRGEPSGTLLERESGVDHKATRTKAMDAHRKLRGDHLRSRPTP